MALSEKLYELRKKRALSQEQLAEQLGVSRQAISKWESGKAVPETDTLISISKYFDVSLDYLMKEENSISENAVSLEVHQTEATNKREKRIFGIATCIIGVVLFYAVCIGTNWNIFHDNNRRKRNFPTYLPCSNYCRCCFAP